MRKKTIYLGVVMLINIGNLVCQPKEELYTLSKEKIEVKNIELKKINDRLDIVGKAEDKIVLLGRDKKLYLYDEETKETIPYIELNKNNNKAIGLLVHDSILYQVGYLNLPHEYHYTPINEIPIDKFEYQDFWLQYRDKNLKIDSFPYHYIDKYIRCNFSEDGKKLICNPYTSVTPGYSPETDNKIYLYDLKNILKGEVTKQVVPCERCLNTFIINNFYYFNKEVAVGQGYDGFYSNIYKAPLNNINDTIKIAQDIEIINITPDGRYILGCKRLHRKYTVVIIDVESRRFQYILGRDYLSKKNYYSIKEKKFAFDFGTHIVFIDFPEEYPFDALENTYFQQTTKEEDKIFWGKYSHKPF